MQGLTVGRMVHFVNAEKEHFAAIVVHVWNDKGLVNLVVFDSGASVAHSINGIPIPVPPVSHETSVVYSEDPQPNTWHWIEPA